MVPGAYVDVLLATCLIEFAALIFFVFVRP